MGGCRVVTAMTHINQCGADSARVYIHRAGKIAISCLEDLPYDTGAPLTGVASRRQLPCGVKDTNNDCLHVLQGLIVRIFGMIPIRREGHRKS